MANIYESAVLTSLTKYIDQLANPLVRESVLEGRTMQKVTVQTGIKYADALNVLTTTLVPQAGGAGLINPQGSVTLSQNQITVSPIKVEEGLAPIDFEAYWTGKMMKLGSYNENIYEQFNEVYTLDKVTKIQGIIDDCLWQGATATGNGSTFSVPTPVGATLSVGWLYQIEQTSYTASVVNGTTYSATGLTGSTQSAMGGQFVTGNAVKIVDNMVSNIPFAVIMDPELYLFLGYDYFRILARDIRNGGSVNFGQGNFWHPGDESETERFCFEYPGIDNLKVFAVRGLNGTQRMLITPAWNLVAGTDLSNDYENFQFFYSELYDMLFFRAKYKIGTGIYYPQYIVYANFSGAGNLT